MSGAKTFVQSRSQSKASRRRKSDSNLTVPQKAPANATFIKVNSSSVSFKARTNGITGHLSGSIDLSGHCCSFQVVCDCHQSISLYESVIISIKIPVALPGLLRGRGAHGTTHAIQAFTDHDQTASGPCPRASERRLGNSHSQIADHGSMDRYSLTHSLTHLSILSRS